MSTPSLADILNKNPWFASVARQHLEKLDELAVEVTWPAGQFIFREGDRDDHLYLVSAGQVALEIHVPNRGRVTILTIGPDEIFGWSAAVPAINRKTASARAVQPTHAFALDAEALRTACKLDHELGCHVYHWLANVIAGLLAATRLQLLDVYAVDWKG